LALLATGCGSKGAVAIVAVFENPHASVEDAPPLAHVLKGGFTLHADLGQVAPSGTDVSIQGAINLVKPADQTTLLAALKLVAMPSQPYHLEPGGHVDATLNISENGTTDGQLVQTADFTAICQAGSVEFAGTLADTVSGKPTPVSSAPFTVTGCP
jgi:hypothetical protein